MEKEANETDTYSHRWMKVKLVEKYGERMYFSEINGKSDVACFRDTAHILLNDAWYNERNANSENEAKRVLDLPANILLGQIRSTEFDTSHYSPNNLIKDTEKGKQWVPSYLQYFMEKLIKNALKEISLA